MSTTSLSLVLGVAAAAADVPYTSPFETYRPFEPAQVQDWRQANDTVRAIGGWRAYAREIQGGAAAAPQVPASGAPAGAPAPAGPHQGHHQ